MARSGIPDSMELEGTTLRREGKDALRRMGRPRAILSHLMRTACLCRDHTCKRILFLREILHCVSAHLWEPDMWIIHLEEDRLGFQKGWWVIPSENPSQRRQALTVSHWRNKASSQRPVLGVLSSSSVSQRLFPWFWLTSVSHWSGSPSPSP